MADRNANKLPKREEIEEKYKWKLEDIYADNNEWEADFCKVKAMTKDIARFKGHLEDSAQMLLECFKTSDELLSLNDKLFVYARMRKDEDNGNSLYQALADRASVLSAEVYASVSFIIPELISIPENKLKDFLASNEQLQLYKQFINEALRQKEHTLSEREEEILALSSEVASAPRDIFTMFNNADIKFPSIKDEKGEETELTKGRYIKFLESRDRRVRHDAFKALYSSYKSHINTLASMLSNNVKKNRFYSSLRKYKSSLEASLDADNISTDVYDRLIDTVNKNLHLLHRYLKLRKRALKLDELHMYDLYVPIVEEPPKSIFYQDALEIVEKGLMPLGEEYIGYLKNGFKEGWIDVFENEGKTGGAYSWGAYKTHPYVLLNYQGTINDVFTLAHEMGHALHSFYSNKTQPYVYSQYKIFVAEVASTANESLLIKYLLDNTDDPKEKAYLLNHQLEEFRGTIFRQVMFAEFERIIHSKAEEGEALTAQTLNEIYRGLNEKYFGREVVLDEEISYEWSRIPHFYSSFYVYKYATGLSAAVSLSQQILKEGRPAVERYISFLSSGGSDYPLELLKKAGVDLSTPQPVQEALDMFGRSLDELEKLI
ncbi:MAG: oligoendopeptidase F [Clostridia bacterium]|nr:oligoendopeptidase F [Clostridia bacterium]